MNRHLKPIVVATASLAAVLLGAAAVPAATTCEGLMTLSLPHGRVTAAQTIAGGTFNTPPGCATGPNSAGLPARRRRRAIRSSILRSGSRRMAALTESMSNSAAAGSAAALATVPSPTQSSAVTPAPRLMTAARREGCRISR